LRQRVAVQFTRDVVGVDVDGARVLGLRASSRLRAV